MGQLHRVPCDVLLCRRDLAQSSVGIRAYCDRSLHLANLFLLLTSALIPLPTAVLSAAIQSGTEFDVKVAVALYATIAGAMCLSWLVVFHVLSIHPYVVEDGVDPDFFPKERFGATLGVILYATAGVAGWLSTPKVALLIGVAGVLWRHQRGSDGNTDTPAIWQSPLRNFVEEDERDLGR